MKYDVVVIGAGVVGGMIARALCAYDLSVCVVDAAHDVAMGASRANSAIVHAGFDAKEGSLKARFNVQGCAMMEETCRELGVPYRNNGSLVIAFNDEDVATLKTLLARGEANGVPGLRLLDADETHAMEPALSENVVGALYAPTAGIVCPYELTVAAVGNAMDNGAELKLDFEVTGLERTADGYTVISAGETLEARYVVNAAGLYSDKIAAMAGDTSFCVHPRRGEYMVLDRACGTLVDRTVFRTPSKMGKGILVTPTVDGNLLVGPTSEDMDDKTDTATTPEGLDRVRREATENVPTIPWNKVITSFCGLRAVGDKGDFIINTARPRFVNVAAIESPGLTSSPAIARYVCELLRKAGLEMKPRRDHVVLRRPFRAFKDATVEEKNEMIRRDPAYGRVVCRCETVTEGEIVEAIRQNPRPRDLDGVKRRTRAQMGRCQGGFCSPVVVDLLARELGVAYEAVTKSGGASAVNVGKTKEDV